VALPDLEGLERLAAKLDAKSKIIPEKCPKASAPGEHEVVIARSGAIGQLDLVVHPAEPEQEVRQENAPIRGEIDHPVGGGAGEGLIEIAEAGAGEGGVDPVNGQFGLVHGGERVAEASAVDEARAGAAQPAADQAAGQLRGSRILGDQFGRQRGLPDPVG